MNKDKEEVYLGHYKDKTSEVREGMLIIKDFSYKEEIVLGRCETRKLYEYLKEYYEQDQDN